MLSLRVNVIMTDSVAQASSAHNSASIDHSQYSNGNMNLHHTTTSHTLFSSPFFHYSIFSLTLLPAHLISVSLSSCFSCLHSFLETSLRAVYGSLYCVLVENAFIIITSSFQRRVHFNFQTPACP